MNYNKIIVVGCPGAGKSTFSRKLAEKTGIPLYHLDALYWKEDWTHISREHLRFIQKIFKRKGNHSKIKRRCRHVSG
ncbi:MAG: AAA family ATPase [Eubacterium sp.]|nr:AAA family ATPase [Eubacterium sp.]